MILEYNGIKPEIGNNVLIQEGVRVEGEVILEDNVSIWFNSTLRGDCGLIKVGKNSNVQELSVLHCDLGLPTIIEENVTIGHKALIHSATIKKNSLIGMGAIVLNGAIIPEFTLVAAGSVVTPNSTFDPGYLIVGSPAKAKRKLTEEEIKMMEDNYKHYVNLAQTRLS